MQNDDLVAATVPQDYIPQGSKQQMQEVLGTIASETNVEFLLTDTLLLAYGSWQEVQNAKQRLSKVCLLRLKQ